VTFLFSDIEGSTRLLHKLGPAAYAEALADHRRVMREAFEAAGGVEVDTQGDAFFVAFADATGALAAATEAQRRLAEGPIRVRIGIHSGEPLLTDEGYVGMDVHQGARVMSAGHGGQVLVTGATRALVPGDGLIALGLHRLKDLTEPQPLYQLGAGEFPPLKTLHQTNLPVQPTPLVGREQEVAHILDLLSRARLVTLTGTGGSGKTRLALQAAAELVEEYRDGVWWVSLAALRDPTLLEPTIAQVVGANGGLAEHLRGRETLLLLDNLEQLLEGAPAIASLLVEVPEVRILATSRERLGIAAEHEYETPVLVPREAVALFTARARQLRPSFEPDEHVASICGRLDGLPLAIELAAVRVKALTPAQILARLGKSLDLLTAGARDAPERHRTLRATIAWSYELLDDGERRVFARLSVFAGGVDLEAAEAICEANVDTLASLVDKGLVRVEGARFFLLETIRAYAAESLAASGPRNSAELRQRHATYFLALAEDAEPAFTSSRAPASMALLAAEHDNLRAARAWFREEGDGKREIRLATAVWPFLMGRGYLSEGRDWLEEALEAEGPGPELRTRALFGAAILAVWQGDYGSGRRLAQESLALARGVGDSGSVARALDALALSEQGDGDNEAAESLFQECRNLCQELGDEWLLSIALNNLGDLALNQGEYERAAALFEESLVLGRKRGDPERIARSLVNLASVATERGDDSVALALLKESLDHSRAAGLIEVVGWGLEGVAAVAASRGDDEPAAMLAASAAALRSEMGSILGRFEQARNERIVAQARSRLGVEAFAAATAEGTNMRWEDAHAFALRYE
jgi:predicted ATPase